MMNCELKLGSNLISRATEMLKCLGSYYYVVHYNYCGYHRLCFHQLIEIEKKMKKKFTWGNWPLQYLGADMTLASQKGC